MKVNLKKIKFKSKLIVIFIILFGKLHFGCLEKVVDSRAVIEIASICHLSDEFLDDIGIFIQE